MMAQVNNNANCFLKMKVKKKKVHSDMVEKYLKGIFN